MPRLVKVTVQCKIIRGNKTLGTCKPVVNSPSLSVLATRLQQHLRKECYGVLKSGRCHKFKVLALKPASRTPLQRQCCEPGAQWPDSLRSLSLKATVEVTSRLPEEMRVHVLKHPEFPRSTYLPEHHKVRCGCDRCKQLQLNGVADSNEGVDGEQRYLRRRPPMCQDRGYWTPTAFVIHVVKARIGGGRHPPEVPSLSSRSWLTFSCPPSDGRGPAVELSVDDLKREFAYRWQFTKPMPEVPDT